MNLNEKIEQVIKKEIKQGYMEIEEDDMMSWYVSLEDMELMCIYLQSVLKKPFFKFPTPKEYKEKIKELFDVEFNGDSTILYDQGIGEVEPKIVLVQSDEVESSMFLSNEGFIVPPFRLPELINYQKHFPRLVKLEDEMEKALEKEDETLILWREMVDKEEEHKESIIANLNYLLRLNNYLFNNEKNIFIGSMKKTYF